VRRLVATTGCPTIDADLALFADVVLRADKNLLLLLRYSVCFRNWYVCGCLAVEAVRSAITPNPETYWRGIGYLEEAVCCYHMFDDKPLHGADAWNAFYDELAEEAAPRLPHAFPNRRNSL
jgi:hypothetical protein